MNEDLTRTRGHILFTARKYVRKNKLFGALTSDGVILVPDRKRRIHSVTSVAGLSSVVTPHSYAEAASVRLLFLASILSVGLTDGHVIYLSLVIVNCYMNRRGPVTLHEVQLYCFSLTAICQCLVYPYAEIIF